MLRGQKIDRRRRLAKQTDRSAEILNLDVLDRPTIRIDFFFGTSRVTSKVSEMRYSDGPVEVNLRTSYVLGSFWMKLSRLSSR